MPITANKSMLGHTLGAAGAIEAIVTVMTIRESCVPPTINLSDPDPAAEGLTTVAERGRPPRRPSRAVQLVRVRRPEHGPRLPAVRRMTDELEPMAVGPGPDGAGPAPSAEPPSDGADRELLALIDRLATLLDRSDLTELEVESGGTGLVLRKPSALAPHHGRPCGRLVTGRRDERGVGHAERARGGETAAQATAVGQGAADRHLLRVAGARARHRT